MPIKGRHISPVEKQGNQQDHLLIYLASGKPLRLLSHSSLYEMMTHRRKLGTRGSSMTKRMFAERDAGLVAEEESQNPSNWRYVYRLMEFL